MPLRNRNCDVFIAGAGPAGLAAAIALRLRGADVLLADACCPPIDKPCGEGVMPEARRALAALGVAPESSGVPFTGITFASADACVSAEFPSDAGLGLRRTILHRVLCERAASVGVRFSFNTPVIFKPGQPLIVDRQPVAARWIVGADGSTSHVRSWAGIGGAHIRSHRFGFRAHFRLAPGMAPSAHVEVHWGPMGQAYITPTAPGEICISAMTRDPAVRLHPILDTLPSLRGLLNGAETLTTERGCLTLTRRLRRVTRGQVALVGDASGSVDAITGEGLALAFRQALLLAESLAAGNLSLYESGHAALLALPQRMASLLLLLDRHPQLRARTLAALAANPAIFRALLSVHVGEVPLSRFIFQNGPALAAGVLTANPFAAAKEITQTQTEPAV